MQTITQFESLPNELLMQCFEYLHAIDIFHSFDDLNWRFSILVRSIPLHLDIGKVKNSKLTQFGNKLLSNPQIKHQIISLIVKKSNPLDVLQTLSSFASLNEFTQLRALIFGNLTVSDDEIPYVLLFLPNLCYFVVENLYGSSLNMLELLSYPTLKTLSISNPCESVLARQSFVSLTRLTVSWCCVNYLCEFFQYSPMLQYLKIKSLSKHDIDSDIPRVWNKQAINLERLIVDNHRSGFKTLEEILQQTPSLRFLMLHSYGDVGLLDANRWCNLIRNILPLLDVFQFVFRCHIVDGDHRMTADKFRLFQGKFWSDQHHWYTEYVTNEKEVCIYTVPYMLDTYEILCNAKRYYSHRLDSADAFAKVTNLEVNIAATNDLDQYYFPNVKSLALNNERAAANHDYPYLRHKHVRCLKTMVDLCNLTHLKLSSECRWKSPFVILHLFKEAVHLSSLKTYKTLLLQLLKNREVCECLNKIKRLDIAATSWYTHMNGEDMVKICQTFCYMEEFRCRVERLNALQIILDHLSKLPRMRDFFYMTTNHRCDDRWLKKHQSTLDLYSFTIDCKRIYRRRIYDIDDYFDLDEYFDRDYYGYEDFGLADDYDYDNDNDHDYDDDYDNDNDYDYDGDYDSTTVYPLEVRRDSPCCLSSFTKSILIFCGTIFVLTIIRLTLQENHIECF